MNEHCGEDTLDGWKKFALDGIIPYFSSLDLWSFYCKEDVFSVVIKLSITILNSFFSLLIIRRRLYSISLLIYGSTYFIFQVRNSAIRTLFQTLGGHGQKLSKSMWEDCLWNYVFPILDRASHMVSWNHSTFFFFSYQRIYLKYT